MLFSCIVLYDTEIKLIQPPTHLPFLIPAEDDLAKPKMMMLRLRLGPGMGPCGPDGAGQAACACRVGDAPLPVTQLWSPERADTRLLLQTGMCPSMGKAPVARAEARS